MKDLTRNLVVMTLLFLFVFSAFSGALIPIADAMKDMDTPVAAIENDTYRSYYDSGNFYDSFRSDIESIGGYVYDSASEEKSKKKTTALDYEFQPIKQVITVKTTATGSKENGNYVESKPLANAIVRINGVPRFTDRNGQVRATLDREYVELFVEKNDYGPYIEIMEVTGEDKTVYLKKASDNIDIYGVMLTDIEYDPVNLINSEYTIFPEALGDYIANMKFLVNVKADRYMLLMDSEVIYSSNENIIYDIDFTDDMEGKKFYAQVEYQEILSEPVLLNLKISIPEFLKESEEYILDSRGATDVLNPFAGENTYGIFDGFGLDFTKVPGIKELFKNKGISLKAALDMRKGVVKVTVGFEFSRYIDGDKGLNDEYDEEIVEEVNKKVKEHKQNMQEPKKQRKKAQQDLNSTNKKIEENNKKIKQDTKNKEKQIETKKNLQNKLDKIDKNNKEQIDKINKQISDIDKNIANLENNVKITNNEINKQKEQKTKYENEIKDINDSCLTKTNALKQQIENANNEINKLSLDLDNRYRQATELSNEKSKGKLTKQSFDSQLEQIKGLIKEAKEPFKQKERGFTLGFEIIGTFEYNFRENKVSAVALSVDFMFGFKFEGKFMAGYVPMFYTVHVKAGLLVQIEFFDIKNGLIDFKKLWEYLFMELHIGFEAELGVGFNNLMSASLFADAMYGVKGYVGFKIVWTNPREYMGSDFEWKVGIRFKLLLVGTFEFAGGGYHNIPNATIDKIRDDIAKLSLSSNMICNNLLAENIYNGSKPQIEKVGDDYVASWIDMEIRNGEPRSVLKYSVYSNGNWGVPKEVYGNGSDFYHDTYFDGKDLHVTWQNIKEGTDITSLEDMCKNSEIYYAKYDSELSQFVGVRQVSNNTTLDMGPKFALQESADQPLTLVWQRNSIDDIIGLTGRNSIVYSTFDEGNWSVPNMLYESDNYFSFVNSAYVDSKLTSAFVEDMDNDLTTDDRKIIVCAEGVQCKIVGSDFEIVNNPQFFKIDGKTRLTFHADGNVRFTDDYVNVNKFDIADGKINDTYQIMDGGNEIYVYYYKVGSDNSPQAYASIYDKSTDSWQVDVRLTSAKNKVTSPSIAILPGGDILTVYNSLDRETQLVSLEWEIKQFQKDFEIEYAFHDFGVKRGDEFDLFLIIKNTGDYTIRSLEISAFGKTEIIELSKPIEVGEKDTIKVNRVYSINQQGQEIITVRFDDIVRQYMLTTRFTDVSIDGVRRIDKEREYYDLILKNSSEEASKVYLDIYYNGELIDTTEMFLSGNETLNYTYFNDEFVNGGYVYFEIRTEMADKYESDNSISFCVEYMVEKEPVKINPYYQSMQIAKYL